MKNIDIEKYPFELFVEENDGVSYFRVIYKDVPYAGGAGDTAEEAIALAKESLALILEDMLEQGETIPMPSIKRLEDDVSGRVTLRMPKSLHRRLIARSEEDGVSLNTTVVAAISEYLSLGNQPKPFISDSYFGFLGRKSIAWDLNSELFLKTIPAFEPSSHTKDADTCIRSCEKRLVAA